MPRKFFKKISPDKSKLMNNQTLQLFSDIAHKAHVWHLSRRSVGRAVFIGIFCALLPIPMQMLVSIPACIKVRANLPISLVCVWLTNPITAAPIFYGTYLFGAFLLGLPPIGLELEMSWEWIEERFFLIWKPLLLGSLAAGLFFASVGYTLVDLLWRRHAVKRWKNRHNK